MNIDEPRPRGTIIGRQITGPPLTEAEHFRKCPLCGGYVDMRDRVGSMNTNNRCRTRRRIGRSSAQKSTIIAHDFGAKIVTSS